jgi:DNA polymerase III subunit beta
VGGGFEPLRGPLFAAPRRWPVTTATLTPSPTASGDLSATVAREDLLAALRWAGQCIPRRPPIQVLVGARLIAQRGGLSVAGFDYESGAQQTILAAGATGRALVPGAALTSTIAALPPKSDVVLQCANGTLILTCGDRALRLPLLPIEDYPALPTGPGSALATVTGTQLADLARTCVAAGRDDTLPVLTGVLLDAPGGTLTAAATDRYRLTVIDTDIAVPERTRLLLPSRILDRAGRAFRKLKQVHIRYNPNDEDTGCFLDAGDRTLWTRPLLGEFPKYRALLPTESGATVQVERQALLGEVRLLATLTPRNAPIRLRIGGPTLHLAAGSPRGEADAGGESPVPAIHDGAELDIAFNPGYLLDGLNALTGDTVTLSFTGPTRPAVITSNSDPSLRYLLMPVRLSG